MTPKSQKRETDLTAPTNDQPRHDLTPRQIVAELDRYIISQDDAKRAVAIALRNRWRRQQLDERMRQEILPKNILMIGPTGVGKTEIARRVSRIVDAPFLKVEATKFTEVGYVGRDVESIVRDLVEISVGMLHHERLRAVQGEASVAATQRLADLLVEQRIRRKNSSNGRTEPAEEEDVDDEARGKRDAATRRRLARQRARMLSLLTRDALDEETVELDFETEFEATNPQIEFVSHSGADEVRESITEFLDGLFTQRPARRVSIKEARRILTQQEAHRLVDLNTVIDAAITRAEESGIVFIDEIDKTITPNEDYGSDVSGEGVQRDLLPIVEGSVVVTRYGPVRTDYMLFIAAGAFHNVRPSDLIPELQGRFPIRVELSSLTEDDLFAILTEPDNALTKQYKHLLAAEGVSIDFAEDGLREIARLAVQVNERTEDIGARRLHTIIERVLEEVSFEAPERRGERIAIDGEFVRARIDEIAADEDLSNFIL